MGVREIDRPIAERVSILDRALDFEDRVDVESVPFHSTSVELETLRLAMRIDDREVLVGRGDDDVLALGVITRSGGGGCVSLRWVLRERGAIVMTNSNADGILVVGLVADSVSAVRVGEVPAILANNAFLAAIGPDDSPVVVVTTPDGDREAAGPPANP
ncbi:MAG: hypothetical protein JWM72_4721 [Actinomycetia bacterium]|nr:hypothetical protein [Actinomycetes bacterium]